MGVIQSAMNQMLGIAGIAARLSPDYETKQELYKLGRQESAIQSQRESFDEAPEPGTSDYEILEGIESQGAELAQRKFELDPTSENLRRAAESRPLMTHRNTPSMSSLRLNEMRGEQANMQAAQTSEARRMQRRNFREYLRNVEIQGGGTVGELPPRMQQAIARQYSRSERRALMDKMDKENNK